MKKKQKNAFGKLKVGIGRDYTPKDLAEGVSEGLDEVNKGAKELVPKRKKKR